MPDPVVALAVLMLVVLVESSARLRVPIGLLLAIALLAYDAELFAIALIGAAGVMLARLWLALEARRGRDRLAAASPAARQRRDAMQAQLSGSSTYVRVTFFMAALPGMPASFLFPMLGAMRGPLWPALAGTIVGRLPILALTTSFFAWFARLIEPSDSQAALGLGVLATLLVIMGLVDQIDWQHRRDTGGWRFRDRDSRSVRMMTMVQGSEGPSSTTRYDEVEILEGEVLGEEIIDADSSSDTSSGRALPPTDTTGS